MTFREKIDKILENNKLGINSVAALEDFVKASRSSINNFYTSNEEPGRKTLKRIKSLPGLNPEWYDTGNGEIFIEKGTYVEVLIKKDPAEDNRILTRNIDRMGELNEFLLKELKRYKERFGDI